MAVLQSKGSTSSLLASSENPRRGSATGVYGLPVPPDNLKLGGTHIAPHLQTGQSSDTLSQTKARHLLDSRGETPNNSGRNSPVCWQPPSLATKNRSNSDQEGQSKPKGFGAFNSIYDVGNHFSSNERLLTTNQISQENKVAKDKEVSGFKKIVKILTFGLSGGEIFW